MAKLARYLVMPCKFLCVCRPYKEAISKEINNDNDLNLHLHDQIVMLASLLVMRLAA